MNNEVRVHLRDEEELALAESGRIDCEQVCDGGSPLEGKHDWVNWGVDANLNT